MPWMGARLSSILYTVCMLNNLGIQLFAHEGWWGHNRQEFLIFVPADKSLFACVQACHITGTEKQTLGSRRVMVFITIQLKKSQQYSYTRNLTQYHSALVEKGHFYFHNTTEDIGHRWVVESADNWENFWCGCVLDVQEMTYVSDHTMHWQIGT